MTARELLVDFINYVFFIAITVFFVVYFVLGGRIDELIRILRSLAPFSIFGLAFLFKLRRFTLSQQRFIEIEAAKNDETWDVSKSEKAKNLLITFFLPFAVIAISFIDGAVDKTDIYQAFFCFLYLLFFHWLLFRNNGNSELLRLTGAEKIRDEIVIYFLPLMMLLIPMLENDIDTVDILQTVSVFSIKIVWHFLLFKKER